MSGRKTISGSAGDVPSGLVFAIVAFLVIVFVPTITLTADLPTALPALSFRSDIVTRAHDPPSVQVDPANWLDESYRAVGTAAANRDLVAQAAAQRQFASLLIDAGGDHPVRRAALRERFLRRFLAAADGAGSEPLVEVAIRHRLVGYDAPVWIDRAIRIAWFDFRWEAMAARESLRDEPVPLDRLLLRIPAAERRAVVAWVLAVDCPVLLGTAPSRPLTVERLRRCLAVRREFIDVASALDASYRRDEARAAATVLFARALHTSAMAEPDEALREGALTAARDAYADAHALYTVIAARAPDRRLRRFMLGAAAGMSL